MEAVWIKGYSLVGGELKTEHEEVEIVRADGDVTRSGSAYKDYVYKRYLVKMFLDMGRRPCSVSIKSSRMGVDMGLVTLSINLSSHIEDFNRDGCSLAVFQSIDGLEIWASGVDVSLVVFSP